MKRGWSVGIFKQVEFPVMDARTFCFRYIFTNTDFLRVSIFLIVYV